MTPSGGDGPETMGDTLTLDAIFTGKLELRQRADGYRFALDSLLLASTVVLDRELRSLLDVGCGVGVVGIAAAFLRPDIEVVGVEIQPGLAELARANVGHNGLESQVRIAEGDIRHGPLQETAPARFDLVMMNPPYYPAKRGRTNPCPERAAAKHELHGALDELLEACAAHLCRTGIVRVIYPAAELVPLLSSVRQAGLKAVGLRPIHSFRDQPARFVILDAKLTGRREMQIAPSVIIYEQPGTYSEAVEALLSGTPHHQAWS